MHIPQELDFNVFQAGKGGFRRNRMPEHGNNHNADVAAFVIKREVVVARVKDRRTGQGLYFCVHWPMPLASGLTFKD